MKKYIVYVDEGNIDITLYRGNSFLKALVILVLARNRKQFVILKINN